jgi:hypothetical protein
VLSRLFRRLFLERLTAAYQARRLQFFADQAALAERLTGNELSDFSRLWHDGCGKTIIEAQYVDRNHSPEV